MVDTETGKRVPPMIYLRCRFCSKQFGIRHSHWARGEGAYCSHGCAGRDKAAPITPKPITDAFGYWLAGLADGESNFDIVPNKAHGNSVRFIIKLRGDDTTLLEMIRDTLGYGTVYTVKAGKFNGKELHPQSSFACMSARSCFELVEVFEKYPLLSKKARDFDIWKQAVRGLMAGTTDYAEMTRLRAELRSIRVFQDNASHIDDSLPD